MDRLDCPPPALGTITCDQCGSKHEGDRPLGRGVWLCAECAAQDGHVAACMVCHREGTLVLCDTCPGGYHAHCAGLSFVPDGEWHCPRCVESMLDVERFLSEDDGVCTAKMRGTSYRRCVRIPKALVEAAARRLPAVRAQIRRLRDGGFVEVNAAWTEPERVIRVHRGAALVKWRGLEAAHATWEVLANVDAKLVRACACAPYRGAAKPVEASRLHPYQAEGVAWLTDMYAHDTSCVLADEMGLGKTVQAAALLAAVPSDRPHLVVAPLSTLDQWAAELATYAPHLRTIVFAGSAASRRVNERFELKSANVVIVNGDAFRLERALFRGWAWGALVVDEAHCLRRPEAALYEALLSVECRCRVLLTGTPVQKSMDHLEALLTFLGVEVGDATMPMADRMAAASGVIQERLLRRTKADAGIKMVACREVVVGVPLSAEQLMAYRDALSMNREALQAVLSGTIRRGSMSNACMMLRQLCLHPCLLRAQRPAFASPQDIERSSGKIALLAQMLPKVLARGSRALVFSNFKGMLDILQDWLVLLRIAHERIDGDVERGARADAVKRFENVQVMLLSTQACGTGLNLELADTVFLMEPSWNPHVDAQAAARAHRVTQTRDVTVYRFVARHTVDERVYKTARSRLALAKLTDAESHEDVASAVAYGAELIFSAAATAAAQMSDVDVDALLSGEVGEAFEIPDDDMDGVSIDAFLRAVPRAPSTQPAPAMLGKRARAAVKYADSDASSDEGSDEDAAWTPMRDPHVSLPPQRGATLVPKVASPTHGDPPHTATPSPTFHEGIVSNAIARWGARHDVVRRAIPTIAASAPDFDALVDGGRAESHRFVQRARFFDDVAAMRALGHEALKNAPAVQWQTPCDRALLDAVCAYGYDAWRDIASVRDINEAVRALYGFPPRTAALRGPPKTPVPVSPVLREDMTPKEQDEARALTEKKRKEQLKNYQSRLVDDDAASAFYGLRPSERRTMTHFVHDRILSLVASFSAHTCAVREHALLAPPRSYVAPPSNPRKKHFLCPSPIQSPSPAQPPPPVQPPSSVAT